jgi:type IV secretory pathway VirB10-like protein
MSMTPDSSPQGQGLTGVRRVNNRPIYIGVAVLGLFLVIMGLVAVDRAKHQRKTRAGAEIPANTDTNFAAQVIGGHNGGVIPAAHQPGPPDIPKPKETLQEAKVPVAMPENLNSPPPPPDRTTQQRTPEEQEAERIRQAKMQAFETAVLAKTTVPVRDLRTKQARQGTPTADAPVLEQIDAMRKHIESLQGQNGGPTQPMTRGAAGTGTTAFAASDNATRNDLGQFGLKGKAGRWRLDSETEAPRTRYELRAGFVMPATMISGISSDLPGEVVAQVSQNVYDTPTGRYLLVPQGARLVGSYSSDVGFGQQRVFIAWQRIVFPDGKALDIGAMPGADAAGYAGFKDKINNHYFRTFGSAFLMSAIVGGVALSQNTNNNDYDSNRQRTSDVLSQTLGQQLGSTMTQMISKNLNVSPTLEIRPGYRFNVMVVKDLTFVKPYRSFDYAFSQKGGMP